jgi:hypothetical protein
MICSKKQRYAFEKNIYSSSEWCYSLGRQQFTFMFTLIVFQDCRCGLVVSSWLQIQRSGFNFQHYQIFWEVVGLGRGPLSLVSTIEELLGRRSSDFGLESLEYGCIVTLNTWYPLSAKFGANFAANKQQSLGGYSSLMDSGHAIPPPF